jgi:hypothetical protein
VPPAKGRPSIFLKLWVAAQRVNLLILHELDVAGASTPHFAMLSMIGLREPLTPTELASASTSSGTSGASRTRTTAART